MIQGISNPIYWISMYPGADSGFEYFIVADNYLNDDGTPYENLSALNPFKEEDLIFLD